MFIQLLRQIVTTEEIYLAILSKPNCSVNNSAVGFIQDLHEYARTSLVIIKETKDPRNNLRALMLKSQMLGLLENYDRLDRGTPNAKRRK